MSELENPENHGAEPETLSATCRWLDEVVESFVDGELEAVEEERVRVHVVTCPRCAESLELARRIRRELSELDVPCPPGVEDELRRRLSVEVPADWRRALRLLPIAATIAALALLGVLFLERPRAAEPDPAELVAAEEQIRLALAYVGEVSHRSAVAAVDEVLAGEVAQAVQDVARRLDRSLAPPQAGELEGAGEGSDGSRVRRQRGDR